MGRAATRCLWVHRLEHPSRYYWGIPARGRTGFTQCVAGRHSRRTVVLPSSVCLCNFVYFCVPSDHDVRYVRACPDSCVLVLAPVRKMSCNFHHRGGGHRIPLEGCPVQSSMSTNGEVLKIPLSYQTNVFSSLFWTLLSLWEKVDFFVLDDSCIRSSCIDRLHINSFPRKTVFTSLKFILFRHFSIYAVAFRVHTLY